MQLLQKILFLHIFISSINGYIMCMENDALPFTIPQTQQDNITCRKCSSNINGCTFCNPSKLNLLCETNCFSCDKCPEKPQSNCPITAPCPSKPVKLKGLVRSIYIPRSIGSNTARRLSGWQQYTHRFGMCRNYLTTAHTLGYAHSFKTRHIADSLFGSNNISIEGSQVSDRATCSLIADNFGLSPQFKGSFSIRPTIDTIYFDNQFYIGLDSWLRGLYIKLEAPLAYTRWDLGICAINQTDNCPPFAACYQGSNETAATCSIIKALSGDFTFGDMKEPWNFSKISCNRLTQFGLADLCLSFGWDFRNCPDYHFGIYSQLIAPTGNKPNGRHLFQPIVGNAHHWELGAGISGHLVVWQNCYDHSVALWIDGYVTHMFENTQCRTFDLCKNGPLSRYLLLKELQKTDSGYEYTGNLINGVNFTTRPSKVSISVKGDVSAKIAYRSPCYTVDIGYNFYGNAAERVCIDKSSKCDKTYGIKSTEGTCALDYNVTTALPLSFAALNQKIGLNSTQSNATITQVAATDNPQTIAVGPNNIAVTAFSRQTGPINGNAVIIAKSSNQPVILTTKDLDILSGTARAVGTHKLFGYFSYNFPQCTRIVPYLGIGAEFEVNALPCNNKSSLNQWSAWLKGGLAF